MIICEETEYLPKTLVNIATTCVDVDTATSASSSYSIRVIITTVTIGVSTDMNIITFTP